MWFFSSLYNSWFNIAWLKKQKDNANRSWSYFFLLVFLLTGMMLIPLFVQSVPDATGRARIFANEKMPDFQADMKGGTLTVTKLPQPYVVEDKGLLFMVDTVSTGTLNAKDLLKPDTKVAILITKDRIEMFEADKNQDRLQYFKNMGDFSTDREAVVQKMNKYLSWPVVAAFCLAMFAAVYIATAIGKLAILLFWSFIVWLVAYMTRKDYKFSQVLNIGLYALTLPSLAIIILQWAGLQIRAIYTLLLILLMMLAVFAKDEKGENVNKETI